MPPKKNQKGLVSAFLSELKADTSVVRVVKTITVPKTLDGKKKKTPTKTATVTATTTPKKTTKDVVKSDLNKTKTKVTKVSSGRVDSKYGRLGQTKETPPEEDSLRRFYTSLLMQKPNSHMALKWCLERGLIPDKKLEEAYLIVHMEKVKLR